MKTETKRIVVDGDNEKVAGEFMRILDRVKQVSFISMRSAMICCDCDGEN